MDTAALVLADLVVTLGSVRGAARGAGVSPGTAAAAIRRLEEALAVDLIARDGASGTVTLPAQARAGALARLGALAVGIVAPDSDRDAALRATVAARLSVDALARFATVVERGSIRAAATAHGVGQPQLTRQLKRLEAVLGAPLLARAGSGSQPTERGRRVARLAGELAALWRETAANGPEDFRRGERTVRFGTIVPLGHESRLARLVADVVAGWPRLRPARPLAVTSTTAAELVSALKDGRLDVALLDAEPGPLGLDGVAVATIRLALALPPGHPAAGDPQTLAGAGRLAVPSRRSGLRQRVDRLLAGLPPGAAAVTEVDSIPVIVDLVLRHGFLSVLPLESVMAVGAGIGALPLPSDYDLALYLVTARGRGDGDTAADLRRLIAAANAAV